MIILSTSKARNLRRVTVKNGSWFASRRLHGTAIPAVGGAAAFGLGVAAEEGDGDLVVGKLVG